MIATEQTTTTPTHQTAPTTQASLTVPAVMPVGSLSLYETVLSLTYTELAERTGLGRKHVSKLLQGRCTLPRFETAGKIAKGLGFSLDEVDAFLTRLQADPMPYRGGRVLDVETVEAIKGDRDGTTREVAARHGTTAETVSKIRRFA